MPALAAHDHRPVLDRRPATGQLTVNQNRRPFANCHTLPPTSPSYQSRVQRESLHCMVKGSSGRSGRAHSRRVRKDVEYGVFDRRKGPPRFALAEVVYLFAIAASGIELGVED
jgi:hypothetical protein